MYDKQKYSVRWRNRQSLQEPPERAAVTAWLAACCFTVHSGVEGVKAEACVSPRWMPGISYAWLGEGEQKVGREKDVELQACVPPKPATFLHPESPEMGAGVGQSISRPQPSLKAVWWENLPRSTEVRVRAVQHMRQGWLKQRERWNDMQLCAGIRCWYEAQNLSLTFRMN